MDQSTEPSAPVVPGGVGELDEATLVGRAQNQDVEAFEELVRRWESRLYRYAYSMLGNRQDAEDALQDTLVRIWRALPALSAPEAFGRWAYRALTRRCLDALTGHQRQRTELQAPDELAVTVEAHQGGPASTDPAHSTQARHRLEELTRQVQQLPPGQRACWLLYEIHGRTYHEIAAALSVPESTVRGRLVQARKQLAKGMMAWR